MKRESKKFYLWLGITLLWVIFIFVHSLQPADVSSKESLGVLAFLQKFFPGLSHHLVRKLGHFTEFTILGVLSFQTLTRASRLFRKKLLSEPGGPMLLALVWGVAVAACDEWIQTGVPGRSGEFRDVLIDTSGVITGILLCTGIMILLRRRKGH